MCTVNDEYESQELIPEKKCQVSDKTLCQKCNVARALVVLRGKDVYCDGCFLACATHKFRATLGKSKIVRPKDKILVAHSGGAGSTALLNLIKSGMHESVHKRLVFETKVIYIDDGAVKGQSLMDRKTIIRGIDKQISSFGFQCYAVSLSQSLNEKSLKIQSLESLENNLNNFSSSDERLKIILNNLSDETSRLELTKKLRKRLFYETSRILGCNKIFVADDSTALAIDILSNVSLGRGAQLSHDVGFIDNRYYDVTLMRPMRDFTRHEISTYLEICNLEIVDYADSSNDQSTIQGITEKFVIELDSRFNGTVSTIFRTGEKISAHSSEDRNNEDNCALCEANLDTLASDTIISAIQATAFSRLVSSQGPHGNLNSLKINENTNLSVKTTKILECDKCNGSCSKSDISLVSREDIMKFLCYGCRLIFRNSDTMDLPNCVLNAVQRRLSLENMREEIGDFLL